ncbi:MFS transporter [Ancylobacter defluvii]|uniref:MFS transporter n=1 Tax=Ancylobacter defluvii TaxID=1282440 RepID=A0A9W6JUD4_9HYPH|nr:MFS transporter [Ancylobacter defluvii]MBS7590080.1 MFS transporter [Ancylobacter defluvii]GLK82698.1 MFS transporter [Ancylobacter defluvii]
MIDGALGDIARQRRANPYAAVGAALAGCFLASYHTRFFGIGLPDLRGGFGLSVDEASWLSTVANAPQILTAPAVPWLVMVFGIRPILMWPGLAYALLVTLIPFTTDLAQLFALHAVTALLLGLFVPATLLVIVRNLSPALWLPAFALYAFRLAFTLNTGPWMTGYLVQTWGWRWLYWVDVPIALLMVGLAWYGSMPQRPNLDMLARADWGGMLLFGLSLTLVYVGLDQGNRLDWHNSGTIAAMLGGGAALMACFVVHEATTPAPWANPKILARRNTILGLATGVVFSFVTVSNSLLVPSFMIGIGQLRPEQFGWFLVVWVALPLGVTIWLGVLLLRRFDFRFVMIAGFASFAAGSLWATHLTNEWRMVDFIPIAAFQAVGLGITFTAVMIGNFTSVKPEVASAFAAYIQILRLVAVEFGIAVMSTFLRIREQTHSNLIGLHVARGDADIAQAIAARAAMFQADGVAYAKARATARLAAIVQREANVLAYIDGFSLTFVVALFGIIVAAAMLPAPKGPLTSG